MSTCNIMFLWRNIEIRHETLFSRRNKKKNQWFLVKKKKNSALFGAVVRGQEGYNQIIWICRLICGLALTYAWGSFFS